jgi:uncharacterized protein YcfL
MEMKKYLALSLLAWILVSCAEPENPGNPINEKETFLVAFKNRKPISHILFSSGR